MSKSVLGERDMRRSGPSPNSRRGRAARWVLRPLLYLGAIVLLCPGTSCGQHLVSDSNLRARFQSHQAEFDSLAQLAVADTQLVGMCGDGATLSVYVRGTSPDRRLLSPEEVQASGRSDYGRLLERAGVPCLSRGSRITFTVQTSVRARKGIMYTRKAVEPLRESLDGMEQLRYVPVAFVQVAPGWFLFIEPKD